MKREHSLQVSVAHMLELVLDPDKTWWSGLDHAAKLSPRYGAERKRRGIRAGLPDLIFLRKNYPTFGVELKAGKGRLSPEQIETADAWAKMGCMIYIARSLEDIHELLELLGVPMRRRMNLFAKEAKHEQPAVRPQTPRHKRPPRRRRSAGAVPAM
jgi:hypothetical protein